jgi:hypothetical protein
MPSKKKCSAGWKKMGYKSMADCTGYGKKKDTTQKAGTSAEEEQLRTIGGMQSTEVGRSKKSRKKRGLGHTNPITKRFHKRFR